MTDETLRNSAPPTDTEYSSTSLARILQRARPSIIGQNLQTLKPICQSTPDELFQLLGDTDIALTGLLNGIAVIGLLLADCEQIDQSEMRKIGWLLATLGETSQVVFNLYQLIESAEPAGPSTPAGGEA